MADDGTTLLFVYGTLKRGGSNHPFLAGQRFLGHARTGPGYVLYNLGGYPGLVPAPGAHDAVQGEVWAVDPAALADIDDLEGVDQGLYRREPVNLVAEFAGEPVQTYVYALSVEGRPVLGGAWRE